MCRRIAVVTGSRAEYGLLKLTMKEIKSDSDLILQTIVTGMHLSREFGSTWKLIEDDGFSIDARVDMFLSGDSPIDIAKNIGHGTIGFADALERLKPDLMLVLGDRYEILAAVSAAVPLGIPVAHMCGGESTEGAYDDYFRHAITKMSHLHFAQTELFRRRIIQMGESPEIVFSFGSPGIESIERLRSEFWNRNRLEDELGLKFLRPLFVVTYHPVTLGGDPEKSIKELLSALDEFNESSIVFTYPNSDAHSSIIIEMINDYVKRNPQRTISVKSLGQIKYLSLVNECDVVIGNSSSGIIEVPALWKPTVNLGNRQKGRPQASSIINCEEKKSEIVNAIYKALTPEFTEKAKNTELEYKANDFSKRVIQILKSCDISKLNKKQFYEVEF